MSYILDALKKSDQERQQGTSPHLYSVHSSAPPGRISSPLRQHRRFGLLFGGGLIFFTCLGIFYILNRQSTPPHSTIPAPDRTTIMEQPADKAAKKIAGNAAIQATKDTAENKTAIPPRVVIKEKNNVLRSVAIKDKTFRPARVVANDDTLSSLPQLQELPADIQAEVPALKFAGHTFSEDPAQRMIIVNGHILREGDTIATDTHLSEITWEGVVIDFKGSRFLVKTN